MTTPSNSLTIEWPHGRPMPRPGDRMDAGELGTAIVEQVTQCFGYGNPFADEREWRSTVTVRVYPRIEAAPPLAQLTGRAAHRAAMTFNHYPRPAAPPDDGECGEDL